MTPAPPVGRRERLRAGPLDLVTRGLGLVIAAASVALPLDVTLHPERYGPPVMRFSRDGVVPPDEIVPADGTVPAGAVRLAGATPEVAARSRAGAGAGAGPEPGTEETDAPARPRGPARPLLAAAPAAAPPPRLARAVPVAPARERLPPAAGSARPARPARAASPAAPGPTDLARAALDPVVTGSVRAARPPLAPAAGGDAVVLVAVSADAALVLHEGTVRLVGEGDALPDGRRVAGFRVHGQGFALLVTDGSILAP